MDLTKGVIPVTVLGAIIAAAIGITLWVTSEIHQVGESFRVQASALIDGVDEVEQSLVNLGTELRRELSTISASMATRSELADALRRVSDLEARVRALEAVTHTQQAR